MVKKLWQRIPVQFRYILSVYGLGILFFTTFRILLFLTELKQLDALPNPFQLISTAFWMGLRFDTVISGYILILPIFILLISYCSGLKFRTLFYTLHYYSILLYLFSFLICAGDIPYFNYYFSRITIAAMNWIDSPVFMFKMIFQEWRYAVFSVVFILFAISFILITNKILKKTLLSHFDKIWFSSFKRLPLQIGTSFFFLFITLILIRGRIEQKSPIRVGTAFFSNYAFPNQLGLNPVFTFLRSYFDSKLPENKELNLMNDTEALSMVRKSLFPDSEEGESPFIRKIAGDSISKKNVVLVIMESMTAEKTGFLGKSNLTPWLDTLSQNALSFSNIYTAGIHTFNGIFSTLFAYPALLKQHPMNDVEIPDYTGFPQTLADKGYQTIYFTTHDDQFDNVGGFLKANGIQQIFSQKDYPSEKVVSTLGVPDHFMFEYSIPILNKLSANQKPFFAAFMTASDHGPYTIPKEISFKPKSADIRHQIVEYADWAIHHFLELAKHETWYKNTLFVFIADHGGVWGENVYDMPLSYHHTPFIIFAGDYSLANHKSDVLGGQIDVFPTVMGILGASYINNTAGIDLQKEVRPCIFFTADDKIGCIDNEWLYVYRQGADESLYQYRSNNTQNYALQKPEIQKKLKNYAFSFLQASQWVKKNKKTSIQK